jgi:hypothetical protein
MKKTIMIMAVVGASVIASSPSVFANAEIWIDGTASGVYAASSGDKTFTTGGITATMNWSSSGALFIDLGFDQGVTAPVSVIVSDNDNPGGPSSAIQVDFSDNITGNLAGSISSYYAPDNVLGNEAHMLTSLPIPTGLAVDTAGANFHPGASTYSLTEDMELTSGSGTISSDFALNVPDAGMTMTMLGMSLLGLGAIRSRLSRQA